MWPAGGEKEGLGPQRPRLAGCRSLQNPGGQTATLGGPWCHANNGQLLPQPRPHFQHQELLPRWRLRLEPQAQPRTLTLSWAGAITSCGLGFLTGTAGMQAETSPEDYCKSLPGVCKWKSSEYYWPFKTRKLCFGGRDLALSGGQASAPGDSPSNRSCKL